MDNYGSDFSRATNKQRFRLVIDNTVTEEVTDQLKMLTAELSGGERDGVEAFVKEALRELPYAAVNYDLVIEHRTEDYAFKTLYSLKPKSSIDISANQVAYTNELESALVTICNALPVHSFLLLGEVFWQVVRAIDKYNVGSSEVKQNLLNALANIAYDPNSFPEYIYDTHSTIRSGRDSEDHESSSKDCR